MINPINKLEIIKEIFAEALRQKDSIEKGIIALGIKPGKQTSPTLNSYKINNEIFYLDEMHTENIQDLISTLATSDLEEELNLVKKINDKDIIINIREKEIVSIILKILHQVLISDIVNTPY